MLAICNMLKGEMEERERKKEKRGNKKEAEN
jgi:hypothetical protein